MSDHLSNILQEVVSAISRDIDSCIEASMAKLLKHYLHKNLSHSPALAALAVAEELEATTEQLENIAGTALLLNSWGDMCDDLMDGDLKQDPATMCASWTFGQYVWNYILKNCGPYSLYILLEPVMKAFEGQWEEFTKAQKDITFSTYQEIVNKKTGLQMNYLFGLHYLMNNQVPPDDFRRACYFYGLLNQLYQDIDDSSAISWPQTDEWENIKASLIKEMMEVNQLEIPVVLNNMIAILFERMMNDARAA
jgi:hypothetical protein